MSSVDGHINRKLLRLRDAGEHGIPADGWRQSAIAIPTMIKQGWIRYEARMEEVGYYVLTPKGQRKVEEIT